METIFRRRRDLFEDYFAAQQFGSLSTQRVMIWLLPTPSRVLIFMYGLCNTDGSLEGEKEPPWNVLILNVLSASRIEETRGG